MAIRETTARVRLDTVSVLDTSDVERGELRVEGAYKRDASYRSQVEKGRRSTSIRVDYMMRLALYADKADFR